MKTIKYKSNPHELNEQPICLLTGVNEQYKSKLLKELLTSEFFYSKKFGRILYIGERRYKTELVVHDELNTFDELEYAELMDKIDDANKEGIINLMLVINTKNYKKYFEIIEKIVPIRQTYLPGIISIIFNVPNLQDLKKSFTSLFNTFFCFEEESELKEVFQEFQFDQKRKKDVFIISKNQCKVYKDIKD